ncbi:MAG TPA: glycosyltransferase 87 family protein [Mycobacteriales bacterium]|nr:glycosyltransferase 87 family protein [Mycobacteriales bacterium]
MPATAAPPVIPSHVDPVARGASTIIGGPVGRHARVGANSLWTPLRVLLLLTIVTFGLGWAQKLPCHGGNYGENNFHAYTRLCYTDVHALWFAEGLAEGKTPYVDHPVEYPVVIGGIMQAATFTADNATEFYDRTSIILLVSALVMTGTSVALAGRRRRWDAALVALAPGLALHGTTNWDLPAAALAGLGLWQWARGRPVWSGVLLGLAVATKLYPAIFFVPLFVLCLRAGKLGAWVKSVGTALGVYLGLNVIGYAIAGKFVYGDPGKSLLLFGDSDEPRNSIGRFFVLNQERGADWDSLWFFAQEVMKRLTDNPNWAFTMSSEESAFTLNRLVAVTFLLSLVAIGVLIWRAPRRPRVGQVLFLTLAAFLLTNKVNSPQYTIWLIPLAVMARPRWGAFLTWQVLELAVMFTRFYMFVQFSKPDRGLPVEAFLTAIAARDIALIVLMGLVVREILRPDRDVVRADGDDDPAGGVLDRAPDRSPRPVAERGKRAEPARRRSRPATA